MSAYLDLIPGPSPSRRRNAYDDLLPGGAPAAIEQPAEDARPAGVEAATEPRVADAAREINEAIIASQPARMTMSPRGGARVAPADLTLAEPEPVNAPWTGEGGVIPAIPAGAVAQVRSAVANLQRMANEENIQQRQQVIDSTPLAGPEGAPQLPHIVRRALERQQANLERERAAREGIDADAAAATRDLALVTPKDMSTLQKGVFSAGTSAPTTLAGMAAGIATRSPALAMAIAGGGGSAIQAGSTYGEAREKGASHELASQAAGIDAIIEGLDALPVGAALKPGSAFLKRMAKTTFTESLTEGGQQLLQDLRSMAMEDPDKTLGEVWDNVKVAAIAGGIGGPVYGAVGHVANAGRETPPAMHSEDAGVAPAPVVEQAPVEPPAPAVPVSAATTEQPKKDTPSAYEDLVPAGAEPDGRIEPTLEAAPPREPTPDGPIAPEPWAQPPEKPEPLGIEHPDIRATLESMAKEEAGWSEIGGRLIRRKRSEVAGDEEISRTSWIPKADWWKGRAGGLNEAQTQEAVRKAIAGEKLGKREQLAINYMVEVANERLAQRSAFTPEEWSGIGDDIKIEGGDPTHENVIDVDLVARASEINADAVETAAMKHQNDDAAFMAEIQRIIGEKDQDSDAAGGRQESRGSPQETGFQLERQSEAELAARAREVAETEARRKAAEEAAEKKRKADAQRGDFTLTGSERTADENPGQGGLFGMPAGTAVAAGAVPMPPASAQSTGGKEKARPDAIRAAMRQLFGAPINEKGFSKRYLGIYRIKPQTVRLQNRNDLRTAAHEIGHHISNLNRPFRKVMRQHEAELIPIAPAAYMQMAVQKYGSAQAALQVGDVRRLLIEEGFAEFIAEYLTAPATIQAKVPGFFADFETWLQANPRYAQSLTQVQNMIGAHQALSPEDKILAKVGVFKPSLGERAATLVSKDTWDAFAQSTLDKWHPLKTMVEDLAPGLAASKNPYTAARLLAGDAAIIEDWISDFTTPFDYAKRLDVKNYGRPLKSILQDVLQGGKEEVNKFKAYLIARRAAELIKVGKENLLTAEEIKEGLKLETGQQGRKRLFEATANLIYGYNDRLLDYAVEGGLLSPEVAAKFKENTAYIPFFREPEGDAKGGGGRGEPFKRLTGGTQNLRDPFANLIQNTGNIIHATNRNAMVVKAVELAKAMPGGGRWLETVAVPKEAHNIATKRIVEELEKQGVQIDTSMAQDLAAMQTFFTPSAKGDDRKRIIVYKEGGELKAVQINDALLWKALGNIPPLQMGLVGKILAFPAKTLRAGVVLDPTFMVRNFVRDTLSATVQSKGKFIPVASTAQGIKVMAQQKDAYRLWRAFGGAFSDQFREPEESAEVLERMAKRGNFSVASIITPTRWLDALRHVGSFTEAGSRIGEFDKTYKPGDLDSALQAALNSREVSTDFGMKGGSEAIQVLTRITPFMNPAMQGLYKTARVLSGGDGKAVAAKAAILGANMALLSMALALLNSDEDWYKEIEEWEKTTYWHFKLAGQVWRIPKPFEYGTLFASIPEAIALRAADKEDGEDFKKRMLQALGQFAFRVVPQAATILAEPWANKSFFTGRKLVPDRQQHLEPGLQANPNTSKVAQVAGEAANVSPAVIDNVVRNVFGTIGVHVETAADLMLEATGVVPAGRERGWQTWPAIKAFVRDPDNGNTKQGRDFYEQLERYRTAVNSVRELKNRSEDTKAETYAAEKTDELQRAKGAEEAAKRLAKIRKAVRAIEFSRDMSPAEKRSEIKAHNEDAQDIAREQTLLYQAAKKSYAPPAIEGGK